MIRVEPLVAETELKYREFLLQDPRSLIYATVEYRNFLALAVGGAATYLLAFDEHRQIVGVFPFFTLEVAGLGVVINSLPWYGSHGGCIVEESRAKESRSALLTRFCEYAKDPNVWSSTVVLTPSEEKYLPEYQDILAPVAYDQRIGQITALPPKTRQVEMELEDLLLQKTRNLVRKSLKQGFYLCTDEGETSWRFLFETHVENMRAVGARHKPWEHFVALRKNIPTDARRLLIAKLDGVPIAGLLLLYFNKTVEYFIPVIKQDYRSRQPLSFLIWHGMLGAINKGYLWWNWGGTWATQESLHHFKAGWGAQDFPYTYAILATQLGRTKLAQYKDELDRLCPFYYAYPYEQL